MILDRIERLPLYEAVLPGAKAAAEAFAAGEAEAAPFEGKILPLDELKDAF